VPKLWRAVCSPARYFFGWRLGNLAFPRPLLLIIISPWFWGFGKKEASGTEANESGRKHTKQKNTPVHFGRRTHITGINIIKCHGHNNLLLGTVIDRSQAATSKEHRFPCVKFNTIRNPFSSTTQPAALL
jgi:hypothetical protein